ncbi:hypothetical protein MKZ79_20730 [Erwinia sp. CGal63]
MRELNTTEVAAVSGAGKIQEKATEIYGSVFSSLYKALSLGNLGYTAEQVKTAGEDLGSRIGGAIETGINKIAAKLNEFVTSIAG